MTENMINKLVAMGCNRWTKGNHDRLYINADLLGVECDFYKSGNISSAWFRGEKISNAQALRYLGGKTYIEVATGEVHSDYDALADAARELIAEEG